MRDKSRVTRIPCEKETRSRAGSRAAGNISAALHDGHFHTNPLRKSGETRPCARPVGLYKCDHHFRDFHCRHNLVHGPLTFSALRASFELQDAVSVC